VAKARGPVDVRAAPGTRRTGELRPRRCRRPGTRYTGGYLFQRKPIVLGHKRIEDRPGTWYLFVLAQDVNTVGQGTDPFTAAHTIGGFVLTDQLELNFDSPCQGIAVMASRQSQASAGSA
jgi:hypothetical protein